MLSLIISNLNYLNIASLDYNFILFVNLCNQKIIDRYNLCKFNVYMFDISGTITYAKVMKLNFEQFIMQRAPKLACNNLAHYTPKNKNKMFIFKRRPRNAS